MNKNDQKVTQNDIKEQHATISPVETLEHQSIDFRNIIKYLLNIWVMFGLSYENGIGTRATKTAIHYLEQTLALLLVGIGVLIICSQFAPDEFSRTTYGAINGMIGGALGLATIFALGSIEFNLEMGAIGLALAAIALALTAIYKILVAIYKAPSAIHQTIIKIIYQAPKEIFWMIILAISAPIWLFFHTIILTIYIARFWLIIGTIIGIIGGGFAGAYGEITWLNDLPILSIALIFIYGTFLIGSLLIAVLLYYFLTTHKSDFFTPTEQIIWVYTLYAILTQNWYTSIFTEQFTEVLLPPPIILILTTMLLILYWIRLVWCYRQLILIGND